LIVGDPSHFAIESAITRAHNSPSLGGLGFFVIHVGGHRYGVSAPDATMLGCSFDEVRNRITEFGRHRAPFATELDAGAIADAFRNAIYADEQEDTYFGVPRAEFVDLIYSNHLMWAPDGDEAFDDSSYVLQFDVMDRVRLIAFTSGDTYRHDPVTLRDVWLASEDFYRILQQWYDAFQSEWKSMPKESA